MVGWLVWLVGFRLRRLDYDMIQASIHTHVRIGPVRNGTRVLLGLGLQSPEAPLCRNKFD